ncbi:MAG TPA: CDP-diacylglycerol--glycerol-3-phosphate 3-phosphatidyltransferase [Thermohalobaculum sp.]|nr:CDP-diacylglycerol--glycerol-3-phosphate 3-phosphatidyltransferase [Thermohalobaculum sp.]
MTWTIPNILSVLRVVAAPCVALAFAVFDRPDADRIALLIFACAALTDYFDGQLARSLGQESAFGKMLDPVADKAMVSIALALLVALFEMHWSILVPAAIIMLREVLISGLREYLGNVKLDVTRLAKWKTTLQMFAVGMLLAYGAVRPIEGAEPRNPILSDMLFYVSVGLGAIGTLVLWTATWFTIITGWDYFRKGLAYIRDGEAAVAEGAPRTAAPESPAREPGE